MRINRGRRRVWAGCLGLLLALPAAVQAQYNYTANSGTITITGYTGPGGAVTIPSTINGLPVTSIGDYAFSTPFSSNTNLTSITIPNSVTSVGNFAFQSCISLINVTIGNSVTSIGVDAFQYCTNLTSVTIPSSVTSIGPYAFAFCTSLTAIAVDSQNLSYSSVDGVLFDKNQTTLIACPGGKAGDYTIPSSVTSIQDFEGFLWCFSLTSVTIPNGVTDIGYDPFYDCSSLTNVNIGTGVTNMNIRGAFQSCPSLTTITVDPQNSMLSSANGVLFDKAQTTLLRFPQDKIGGYTIPDTVTNIRDFAFSDCNSLTNITIPGSVMSMGWQVFSSCTALKSITIGNGVNSIGVGAFEFCTSLTSIIIPNTVTSIASETFKSCTNLTAVYFQGNAPSIGPSVFYDANNTTVYYLLGATGWGSTFGERPTALWKLQVQTSDASFGVRSNQFGFNVSWASGLVIVVEACTNLSNPIWSPVKTNTLTDGSFYFSDPQWVNYPVRFYRLHSP